MQNKTTLFLIPLFCMSLNACTALKNLSQQHFPQNTINTTKVADRWQATLPHGGNSANLAQFWQQYQDPLLLKLIEAAQKESSSIATANSRIAQARACLLYTSRCV